MKLKEKIQNQNVSMENFDQYLTLVQNDVQMKVETMKNHLEKYGEQFVENLKTIRKEVQKYVFSLFFVGNYFGKKFLNLNLLPRQWSELGLNNQTNALNGSQSFLNNVVQQQSLKQQQQLQQQHLQLQQHQQQIQQLNKEKSFQLIGYTLILSSTNKIIQIYLIDKNSGILARPIFN